MSSEPSLQSPGPLSSLPPVIVGIAGGTGSGKTTVADRLQKGIGESSCLIQHDWYYRDHSHMTPEELEGVNFDHPESLESSLLVEHLRLLKAGHAVEAPQYDFSRHARKAETQPVHPLPVIVVEGILLFAVPELREMLDLKVFVDTDADIRVFRRIRRDLRERGRDFESVRRQYYETVRPMHMEFVEPSKRWADLIVPEGGHNHIAIDVLISRFKRFVDPR